MNAIPFFIILSICYYIYSVASKATRLNIVFFSVVVCGLSSIVVAVKLFISDHLQFGAEHRMRSIARRHKEESRFIRLIQHPFARNSVKNANNWNHIQIPTLSCTSLGVAGPIRYEIDFQSTCRAD